MSKLKDLLFGGLGATTRAGDAGLLVCRVITGAAMAYGHGYAKVFENGFGPDAGFVSGVGNLGFPAPLFFAWMAALSEFLGGVLLALGLMTRPAAFLVAGTMAVAAFGQHASDPFKAKELALLYLGVAVLFMLTGGGRFAVDRFFRRP